MKIKYLSFCMLLGCSSGVLAQKSDAEKAFSKNDFMQALNLYKNEFDSNEKDSTRYNIGVCLYKIGSYEKAKEHFLLLLENDEFSDLAAYNLALIAAKLGFTDKALTLFYDLSIEALSEDVSLLAYKQYTSLNKDESKVSAGKRPRWGSYMSVGFGYDDSLVSIVDDGDSATAFNSQGDGFKEYLLNVSLGLPYGDLDFNYFESRYDTLTEYNINYVGLYYKNRFTLGGRSSFLVSPGVDEISVNGESHLRNLHFKINYEYDITKTNTLQIDYRLTKAQSIRYDGFDASEGRRHRAELSFDNAFGNHNFNVAYRYESGVLNDYSSDDTYKSYSADRYGLSAHWAYGVGSWQFGGEVGTRDSEYKDENIWLDENDIQHRQLRNDNQTHYQVEALYDITDSWMLGLRFSGTSNDSNIDLYSYDQQTTTLTLSWAN